MGNIGNVKSENISGSVVLKNEHSYLMQSFYFKSIFEPSEYKKFIKSVERVVRKSTAYNMFIKQTCDRYTAMGVDNVNKNIDAQKASIEIHHYPFTLYDICDIVATKEISLEHNINSFIMADIVLQLHFDGKVGIVPLTITNHQLAHAGQLFISTRQIYGDYEAFMEEYKEAIPDKYIDQIVLLNDQSRRGYASDFSGALDVRK